VRIQEEPRSPPDTLVRARPRAREDRGRNENGRHGEYLSNKASPRGRSWNDVLWDILSGVIQEKTGESDRVVHCSVVGLIPPQSCAVRDGARHCAE